jgi:hypothetical protein
VTYSGEFENNYNDDFDDADRWDIAELVVLIQAINRQGKALERLYDEDPMGMCWFGESDQYGNPDAWIDKRLSWKRPK